MDEPLDDWFRREILSHEPPLVRYLTRVWPRKHEILDLRQETYARVYQAAATSRPASPRAFLFTTAHHLMADRVRHERIVSIEAVGDIEALHVLNGELGPDELLSAREELKLLAAAMDRLPPRCREVMWLRRVEGLSQKETAERLSVSVKAIEQQMSKGVRLLAEYLALAEADESRGARSGAATKDRGAGQT